MNAVMPMAKLSQIILSRKPLGDFWGKKITSTRFTVKHAIKLDLVQKDSRGIPLVSKKQQIFTQDYLELLVKE